MKYLRGALYQTTPYNIFEKAQIYQILQITPSPKLVWEAGKMMERNKNTTWVAQTSKSCLYCTLPLEIWKSQIFVSWTFGKTTLVFNVNISLILISSCLQDKHFKRVSHLCFECRLGENYVVEQHGIEMFDDKDRGAQGWGWWKGWFRLTRNFKGCVSTPHGAGDIWSKAVVNPAVHLLWLW